MTHVLIVVTIEVMIITGQGVLGAFNDTHKLAENKGRICRTLSKLLKHNVVNRNVPNPFVRV